MAELTREQIEKVLRANLGNILAKVKAGKVLSKAERDLFEEHANTEAPDTQDIQADNMVDLAKRLGIRRQLLYSYRTKYREEAPKDLSIAKWREFAMLCAKGGTIGGNHLTDTVRRKSEGEARKVELACEKLQLEIDELRGDRVSKFEVQSQGEAIGIVIQAVFTRLEKSLNGRLSGKTPEERQMEIRKICSESLEGCINQLRELT